MAANLQPEGQARLLIDEQLAQAGWSVCDRDELDLVNHPGSAVREVIMEELEAALGEFAAIVEGLGETTA